MLMHWIARHLAMPSYSVEASCGRQLEVLGCRHPGGHGYLHRLRHISSRGRSDRVRPGLDVAQRVEAIAVVVVRVFLEQRQEVAVGRNSPRRRDNQGRTFPRWCTASLAVPADFADRDLGGSGSRAGRCGFGAAGAGGGHVERRGRRAGDRVHIVDYVVSFPISRAAYAPRLAPSVRGKTDGGSMHRGRFESIPKCASRCERAQMSCWQLLVSPRAAGKEVASARGRDTR